MPVVWEWWVLLGVIAGFLIALGVLIRIVRRRQPGRLPPVDLSINVMELGEMGPPAEAPVLEYQGFPVRLAAVVLAASGRARPLPPSTEWPRIWEAITPGLSRVVRTHQPALRTWPAQLSESGFVHRFFTEVKTPPPAAAGSPWCATAGPVRFQDQTVLVGMVFRTEEPTTLGSEAIESPTGWRRVLSVRTRL